MQLTKNFNLDEFGCHDGSKVPDNLIPNVQELAENLQVLRDFLGEPIFINSAYRTTKYNKSIGGAPASQHLFAKAADIRVNSKTPNQLAGIIDNLIAEGKMKQGGIGRYKTFTHYDIRGTKARWSL